MTSSTTVCQARPWHPCVGLALYVLSVVLRAVGASGAPVISITAAPPRVARRQAVALGRARHRRARRAPAVGQQPGRAPASAAACAAQQPRLSRAPDGPQPDRHARSSRRGVHRRLTRRPPRPSPPPPPRRSTRARRLHAVAATTRRQLRDAPARCPPASRSSRRRSRSCRSR